jgi:hypothetical protein
MSLNFKGMSLDGDPLPLRDVLLDETSCNFKTHHHTLRAVELSHFTVQ